MSKRRRFSREFKLDVVRMVIEGGHSATEVSKDLELRPEMDGSSLGGAIWRGPRAVVPGSWPAERAGRRNGEAPSRAGPRAGGARHSKKSGGDLFGAPSMRFAFIRQHRAEFSVRRMCCVLEVSTSGYYAWLVRPESERSRGDRLLKSKMAGEFKESRETYGSRRLGRSVGCGRTRSRRLMREGGLVAKKTRQFRVCTTDSSHSLPVAENLVAQNFTATGPDQIWAGDITQIRTREGWLYLAVLLDLFSRKVVGWAKSSSLESSFCHRALERAVASRRAGPGLIHHTDRGSQGGFNWSSQHLVMEVFRWELASVRVRFERCVARCGHLAGPRQRGARTGSGSGRRSLVGRPARTPQQRLGCRRLSDRDGSGKLVECDLSRWLRCRGVICRSPSVKRSPSFTLSMLGYVRSLDVWVVHRRRFRGSCAATRRLAAVP